MVTNLKDSWKLMFVRSVVISAHNPVRDLLEVLDPCLIRLVVISRQLPGNGLLTASKK